jgi:phosphohistidine phosphatase SixA
MRAFLILAAFAASLVAQELPATVFLLRHAERSGPNLEDPITSAGRERAELVARMFREAGVSRIYTSEFLRTRQTAAPLSKLLGIEAIVVKGGDAKAVVEALSSVPAGTAAVAVRHSGEIERTVELLNASLKIPKIEETEYDRLLILTFQNGKLTGVRTLRYGAATAGKQ